MYYLIYGLLYTLSLLPLWALHGISRFTAFLVFRVFGYRRNIIDNNIAIAFPEKSAAERKAIAAKFQLNFTDTFLETVKSISAGKKFFDRHCSIDTTLLEEQAALHQSFHIHACHQFNWEWVNLQWALHAPQPIVAVYMPISSKPLEKIFYNMRTRFGTVMLPATDMKNSFVSWRNKEHALVLVADQNPGDPFKADWLNFFSKPVPFVQGPARNAVLKKCPLLFCNVTKKGRGRYHTEFHKVCDDASELGIEKITLLYRNYIQQKITEQPEMYLWSHRRWKWQWKEEHQPQWIDTVPPLQ